MVLLELENGLLQRYCIRCVLKLFFTYVLYTQPNRCFTHDLLFIHLLHEHSLLAKNRIDSLHMKGQRSKNFQWRSIPRVNLFKRKTSPREKQTVGHAKTSGVNNVMFGQTIAVRNSMSASNGKWANTIATFLQEKLDPMFCGLLCLPGKLRGRENDYSDKNAPFLHTYDK